MALLGVNIDHVATVRNARGTDEPDPVWGAVEAELGGADGITFHLREDRRHITDRDARLLRDTVAVKLNMEMAIADDIVDIALQLRPDQSTLVPERREELTTEGGLDVVRHATRVRRAVERLREAGIIVSAFIEPVDDQIAASVDAGFHAIELWTGAYAHATAASRTAPLADLRHAVDTARDAGLDVHGGHGLTYRNVAAVA
ncbi:MAG: pyridoxine 5'-phosphate synthase, partial [Phycisphaerae bacterium]